MRKYLALLLIFVTAISCFGLQNDDHRYHLRQYTDENGLPQNSVQDIAFGNYGFVWIATGGGLARFDGQNMRVFSNKELSVNSDRYVAVDFDSQIGTDNLTAITEHRQLVLRDGGIAVMSTHSNAQQRATLGKLKSQLLSKGVHLDTTRGTDNYLKYKLVVGQGGLYYLYADQRVAFFEHGKLLGTIPFKGQPYFKPLPSVAHARREIVAKTKQLVCADNFMRIDGGFFYHLGSEGDALLKLSPSGSVPVNLTGAIELNRAFAKEKDHIRIIANRFKGQAFAYLDRNIYQILFDSRTGRLETKLLIENLDIDEKLIHRMLYDEGNGTLLLGSVSQGLFVVRPNLFKVVGTGNGDQFNSYFYAQVPFTKSSVITPEGLIISDSDFKSWNRNFLGLPEDISHFSMARDDKGYFWGIERHGVFMFDGVKRQVWSTDNLQPERVFQGLDGNIYIGFVTGELALLPQDAGVSQRPKILAKVNAKCTFLHQDQPGRIWIGTSSGIFMYDILKKRVYPVAGLVGKNIRSIMSTRPDELWITTYGDGIFLIRANRLYKMPSDDNDYLAHAHCILKDDQGYLWISSNKGLFRTKEQELLNYAAGKTRNVLYLYYNKNDGFLTNEFNGGCQPCGLRLDNGYFSFPTMNGLVWFKPEDIRLPDLSAPIRLEEFKLDEKPINVTDTIDLPYNYEHLSITAVSAYMGNSNDVEFLYSIQKSGGEKSKWNHVSNGRQIHIYRLSAGTYSVIVRQPIGFEGKFIERRLTLKVNSAWFVSWWFILLMLVVIAEGLRQITKWRVRNLTRQNTLLLNKVNERTSDLSRTLEELKATDNALQTQLQIQMRIIGALNHDLHAPLRSLSEYMPRYLQQVAFQPNDPQTVRLGEAINKSTSKVFQLADELLLFIKATYNKKGQISYEQLPLNNVLQKKLQFFSEMAQENQVELELDCDNDLNINSNRVMVEILFHNLIDNALKHTYGQVVRIAAATTGNEVTVRISDTGYGMDQQIIEWLNHRAGEDITEMPQTPPNLGLGLIMVTEIAILLGIRIHVASGSEGTTFVCTFVE